MSKEKAQQHRLSDYLEEVRVARQPLLGQARPSVVDVREGDDYYFDERGLMVFTEAYHRRRGSCCGKTACKHCPFGNGAAA